MDIHKELELQDCPYCGGPGLLRHVPGLRLADSAF